MNRKIVPDVISGVQNIATASTAMSVREAAIDPTTMSITRIMYSLSPWPERSFSFVFNTGSPFMEFPEFKIRAKARRVRPGPSIDFGLEREQN